MNIADVITIGREALWVTMLIAGPLLGAVLIVGIIIGIFQAATSIQEMTLSFIPKLIVLVIVLLLVGGWQLLTIVDYFQRLLLSLPIYLQ
jgi:flagellar biosynthetic protein FliQ